MNMVCASHAGDSLPTSPRGCACLPRVCEFLPRGMHAYPGGAKAYPGVPTMCRWGTRGTAKRLLTSGATSYALRSCCAHTYTYTHIHIHTYTHTHTRTHTHIHVHIHIHGHTCIHTYTYAYTYIHAQPHTHLLVHSHIPMLQTMSSHPQGTEGGGHTGKVATSVLIPQCVEAVRGHKNFFGTDVMIVGAGGIYNGRGG